LQVRGDKKPEYGKVWGKLAIEIVPSQEMRDDEMVNVSDWIPSAYVGLMYATNDNFTGQVIYDFSSAYLRYGTVKKLIDVQKKLNQQGYSLKICDAFRPVSAQFKLWEVVPDPNFVADPYHGYSTHSRGNTVDVTLVTITGDPVEMPTEVDTFSRLADRDYSDVSEVAAKNALLLQNIMVDAGFKTNSKEWWHYYDEVSYPVAMDFIPVD
jgi:zinc D-Ala-D-Ala dipeptidase